MRLTLATCAVLSLCATEARAALIAHDYFNDPSYSNGSAVDPYGSNPGPNTAGSGFTAGWQNGGGATSPFTVTSPLSYSGLSTPGNGAASPAYIAATYTYNSTAVRYFVSNTATSDLWLSFLIQPNGISPTNFAAYPNYGGIGLAAAGGGNAVYAGIPGTQPTGTSKYSLQTFTGGGAVASGSTTAASGQTALIVVDLNYSYGSSTAYLWVNPTLPTSSLSTSAADASIAVAYKPSDIAGLYWSDSYGWTYGALRIGTTAADVLPADVPVFEPASLAMLLSGVAGLGLTRRRRAHA